MNGFKTDFDQVSVDKILIPIYPKIRLPFGTIYEEYLKLKQQAINNDISGYNSSEIVWELFLTDIRKYKDELLYQKFSNKNEFMFKFLPRFLWIIRTRHKDSIILDYVYDGTSVTIYKEGSWIIEYS